jgi:hypothetical protein
MGESRLAAMLSKHPLALTHLQYDAKDGGNGPRECHVLVQGYKPGVGLTIEKSGEG